MIHNSPNLTNLGSLFRGMIVFQNSKTQILFVQSNYLEFALIFDLFLTLWNWTINCMQSWHIAFNIYPEPFEKVNS